MADFADLMGAMANVVLAAQRWRDSTNEQTYVGLLNALNKLDALDQERLRRLADGNSTDKETHEDSS